jgi:hypothetical protein
MYCRVWLPLFIRFRHHLLATPFRCPSGQPYRLPSFTADTSSTMACTVVSGFPYFVRFRHLLATPFRCPSGQPYCPPSMPILPARRYVLSCLAPPTSFDSGTTSSSPLLFAALQAKHIVCVMRRQAIAFCSVCQYTRSAIL